MKNKIGVFTLLLLIISCAGIKTKSKISKTNVNSNKNYVESDTMTHFFERDIFTTKMDTSNYLKSNFVDIKEKYINHPFSAILLNLKLTPKSYFVINSSSNRYSSNEIEISFDSFQETIAKGIVNKRSKRLGLVLNEYLQVKSIDSIGKKYHGDWSKEIEKYFSTQIVKDIY